MSGWFTKMIRQDLYLMQYGVRRKLYERSAERNNYTIIDILEKWARKNPNINFLIQNEKKMTYREMELEMSNRGRTFHDELGLGYG